MCIRIIKLYMLHEKREFILFTNSTNDTNLVCFIIELLRSAENRKKHDKIQKQLYANPVQDDKIYAYGL